MEAIKNSDTQINSQHSESDYWIELEKCFSKMLPTYKDVIVGLRFQEPRFCLAKDVDYSINLLQCLVRKLPNLQHIFFEINPGKPSKEERIHSEQQLYMIRNELQDIEFVFAFKEKVINRMLTFEAQDETIIRTALSESFQVFVIPDGQTNFLDSASFEKAQLVYNARAEPITITDGAVSSNGLVLESDSFFNIDDILSRLMSTASRTMSCPDISSSGLTKKFSNIAQMGSAR